MTRYLFVLAFCLGLSSASAGATSPDGIDAVMRHYDAAAVAGGGIQVSAADDVAYVSGVSPDGPWLDVWHRRDGEWKRVAEIATSGLTPIRFGAKRDRSCRRTS